MTYIFVDIIRSYEGKGEKMTTPLDEKMQVLSVDAQMHKICVKFEGGF